MECVLSGKLLTVEEDGVQLSTEHYNGANCVHRPKMNPSSLGLKRNNFFLNLFLPPCICALLQASMRRPETTGSFPVP